MRSGTGFVGLVLLICVFLFTGCKSTAGDVRASKPKDAVRVSIEQKKTVLLKRLERKFEDPDAQFELGQFYHADGLWSQAVWR